MVIPVHDENPLRHTPWVTWLLVGINVVVFLLTPGNHASLTGSSQTAGQQCRQLAFYERYGAIPTELTHNRQQPLAATGAVGNDRGELACVVAPPKHHKVAFASAITSQFIHGSWLHLLGNMLFLVIFGNNVEDRMGRLRFLLFYLVAGLVAAYGFALAQPHSTEPLIGASGAIAGVLGAYLVLFPRARVWSLIPIFLFIPLRLPAWLVLGGWFVLQWAYASGKAVSSGGDVAYLAHVFGFIFGMLVGTLFLRVPKPAPRPGHPASWR